MTTLMLSRSLLNVVRVGGRSAVAASSDFVVGPQGSAKVAESLTLRRPGTTTIS